MGLTVNDKDLYSDLIYLYWTQWWTWIYASYFSKSQFETKLFLLYVCFFK